MAFRVHQHASVDEFLVAAGDFLEAREAEHNLLFGIASWVRVSAELLTDGPATFASVTDARGRMAAATLRTPPHNQVLSCIDDLGAVDALLDALSHEPLPGVLGPTDAAARFAEGWTGATGQPARVQVAERIFRLERVIPPARPASGSWRVVEPRDRDLIARWLVAFTTEAMPGEEPPADPNAAAERWIAQVGRVGYVWEEGGQVVSLVGAGGETP
ncbi:MAG: hypothetical protein ACRDFY_00910, partial [Candidatus Limnocylindria bacterium]